MATLCFTPYLSMRFSKGLLQKCEPPSLIMGFGTPEPRKDVCFQEFKHHSVVIGFAGDCFNPLRHIVYSHQYVCMTIRYGERSHEVDAPNIE